MPLRIVQSQQNSRLKALRRALTAPPRGAGELAAIEGPNLLTEAVRTGLRIPTVFVAQGSEGILDDLRLDAETEVLIVPKALLIPALATETPQPVAALVEPPAWSWKHLLESFDRATAPLIVVLAGVQDPGNLGTILRSAEAFGATGIVSLPGTVSAWNLKAVRASAGSVFRVPLVAADADDCFEKLRAAGVRILTTAAHVKTTKEAEPKSTPQLAVAATSLRESSSVTGHDFSRAAKASKPDGALAPEELPSDQLANPVAILIGNEGNGVPPEIAVRADGAISIPCPGPVESLNAAVAASVLLYEASRQRSIQTAALRKQRGARR